MLPKSLCFIDVETSGMSPVYGRVIEVGIIRVDDGKITKKYKTLVNPQMQMDPYIELLTGIKYSSLEDAPTFFEIKEEIVDILKDAVFVAHSVRFDYAFIKNELKRFGINFSAKQLCTVKLARALYPELKKYNLDSIIANFNIKCEQRHRAFDDANVIYEFYKKSQKNIHSETFEKTVNKLLNNVSVPSYLSQNLIEKLPQSSGVYIFYSDEGTPIYIGKSINIKERVLSHFTNDHASSKEMKISQNIRSIEAISTAGELGALLLESSLIKKHKPIYNRMLRDARKMVVLLRKKLDSGYLSVEPKVLDAIEVAEYENILAVFKSQKQFKDILFNLAKENGLCPQLLGLEKGKGECFYYQLGICRGACVAKEQILKYNLRFEEAFLKHKVKSWLYDYPIAIMEKGDKNETHIIDKWCYLGSLKDDSESIEDLNKEYIFDYDTYKILYKYVTNPSNQKYIKILR